MTLCPKCGSENLVHFSYQHDRIGAISVKKAGRHCPNCGYSDGDWNGSWTYEDTIHPCEAIAREIKAMNRNILIPSKKEAGSLALGYVIIMGICLLLINRPSELIPMYLSVILAWVFYLLNRTRAE